MEFPPPLPTSARRWGLQARKPLLSHILERARELPEVSELSEVVVGREALADARARFR